MKPILSYNNWAKMNEESSSKAKGFHSNIESDSNNNSNFRQVVYTGANTQLVLMSLKPGEDIGLETHEGIDQFFRVESGNGECVINDSTYKLVSGDALVIPAGSQHNITNTGDSDLKLYSLYSPPHHKDGTIHATKADAEKDTEKYDGGISE